MHMRVMSGARSSMVDRLARAAAALVIGLAWAAAHGQTATRPFAALRPASGAAAAAHALVVELAPREALSGAHLDLAPSAEPPAGSRYIVWVNGALTADVQASGARQILALAPSALVPGVNTIELALAPHGVPPASGTTPAPVDDARSMLSLDFAGMRPNPAPTLAQIPLAFDAHAWLPRTLTVDLGDDAVAPGQLQAAAIAVQGVAARMRQTDVTVTYSSEHSIVDWGRDPQAWGISQEDIAAGDVLLVGTRAALARELPAAVARTVTGPFIGIYPVNGGKAVVVVISGATDADCVRAAQRFANPSASFPGTSAIVLDSGFAVSAPATHVAVALAEADPSLVRAVLRFAAVRAKATGTVADFPIRFSSDTAGANVFFGRDSSLSPRLRRQLPIYAPLQPGEVVSLPARIGGQPFVAIVGVRNAALVGAIDMLRKPATWSLFMQHATLFDTRADSAIPLAAARRSVLAEVRLFLADPLVFWSVLLALLLASFIFVNLALKAQIEERLDVAGRKPSSGTPQKTT